MLVIPSSCARKLGAYLGVLACLGTASAAAPTQRHTPQAPPAERIIAARVPGGGIRVLVLVHGGEWPAGGMRIENEKGEPLAMIKPDAEARAVLDANGQHGVDILLGAHDSNHASDPLADAMLTVHLATDWTFARAAGAGIELSVAITARRLRAVLLDGQGKSLRTLEVTDVANDAGPAQAQDIAAEAKPTGVTLSWNAGAAAAVPAFAFNVEREFDGHRDALTPGNRVLAQRKPGERQDYRDSNPPAEADLAYAVRLVDVLGVEGAPARVKIHAPDFSAGRPPAGQFVAVEDGAMHLHWKQPSNPLTRGIVVERAQLLAGPYEILTPQGLPPQSDGYIDRDVVAGASYYYRIRSVLPDRSLGPAADPVHAQSHRSQPLPAPSHLRGEAGISDVRLQWDPVNERDVVGYLLERRDPAVTKNWTRLGTHLLPDVNYVDSLGQGAGGSLEYRVAAYGSDEVKGKTSEVLRVVLRDTSQPSAPTIVSVDGSDGRVRIAFRASAPVAKTVTVALVRAPSDQEDGLVVGAPVPVAAGVIADEWVEAGKSYFYRLVAFDAVGGRSEESPTVRVRVGAPVLPQPAAPKVRLVTSLGAAPRAQIEFASPPAHARVLVQVQQADGHWHLLTGPIQGTGAVDPNPAGPDTAYRIVLVGDNGAAGPPSELARAGRPVADK